LALGVGVVTLIACATACGDDDDAGSEGEGSVAAESATSVATAGTSGDLPDSELDAAGAAELALTATPGAVIGISQGDEDGQPVWDVVVRVDDGSGMEHYIARATGDIVKSAPYDLPTVADIDPPTTFDQAMAIAVDEVAGGSVIEADLADDDGQVVWDVLVSSDDGQTYELYIDVDSGSIVSQEVAS
jgi:uncharacterized membrane protein YkoI